MLDAPLFDIIEITPQAIAEAKAIGYHNYKDIDTEASALLVIFKLGDKAKDIKRSEAKKAKNKYEKLKADLSTAGWQVLLKFIVGEVDKETALKMLKDYLERAYEEAWELGYQSSGVSDFINKPQKKKDWVEKSLKHELKFVKKFLDDIEIGRGRMDYKKRWSMYVNTLDHVYWAGKLAPIPHTFVIDWVVDHKAERCEGCRYLSMNSPYTIETLPTTPRAGMTPCLSNCKCKLRVRPPRNSQEYVIARRKNRQVLLGKLNYIKLSQ